MGALKKGGTRFPLRAMLDSVDIKVLDLVDIFIVSCSTDIWV